MLIKELFASCRIQNISCFPKNRNSLILGNIWQSLVRIQIQRAGDRLGLAHVLEQDFLFREQFLEHIRNLELGAGRRPFAGVLPNITRHIPIRLLAFLLRGIFGNIDRVIHQAHPVIGGLVLKDITVLFAVIHDELDNLRRCVRDFDGVRLDVGNSKALFLDLMLEVDHEQGSALGDDIIFVPGVPEGVLKVGRGKTID